MVSQPFVLLSTSFLISEILLLSLFPFCAGDNCFDDFLKYVIKFFLLFVVVYNRTIRFFNENAEYVKITLT